jgi:hypothetical protein
MATKALQTEPSAPADVVTIKSIDEHPVVIELRERIAKLTQELVGEAAVRQRLVKDRDDHIASEKVRLQSEIFALQDRFSKLQEWALEVRAAANKPIPA